MDKFEDVVKKTKETIPLQDDTNIGDIVMILTEQGLIGYARIDDIVADKVKKGDWWIVSLRLLHFPPQKVAWILRTPQFTGKEIFTMGGNKMFIKALDFSKEEEKEEPKPKKETSIQKKIKDRSHLRIIK